MPTHCNIASVTYEVERQRHNKQVNYTQDSSFFSMKKEELPWVGFEPTTLCSLDTRYMYNDVMQSCMLESLVVFERVGCCVPHRGAPEWLHRIHRMFHPPHAGFPVPVQESTNTFLAQGQPPIHLFITIQYPSVLYCIHLYYTVCIHLYNLVLECVYTSGIPSPKNTPEMSLKRTLFWYRYRVHVDG